MHWASAFTLCNALNNPAATDNHVAVVHNHCLSLGNSSLWLVEFDVERVVIWLGYSSPLLGMVVANACLHAAGLGDTLAVDKIDIRGCEGAGEKLLVGGEHYLVALNINVLHVHGLGQSQA